MGKTRRVMPVLKASPWERAWAYFVWTAFGTLFIAAAVILAVAMLVPARISNY